MPLAKLQRIATILSVRAKVLFSVYILVGCAQTAAVLGESMVGGMGDRWDFVIGWLID